MAPSLRSVLLLCFVQLLQLCSGATLPRIATVQPADAPPTGGTSVTVNGNFFENSQDLICRFARVFESRSVKLLSVGTWISSTRVLCPVPAWEHESCAPPSGCPAYLTVSNDGIQFSGGPLGIGGTSLRFLYITTIPTIPLSRYLTNYALDSPVDQLFAGGTAGWISPTSYNLTQSFTAGVSSELASVILPLNGTGEAVTLELISDGQVLASLSITPVTGESNALFDFSSEQVSLYKGESNYALQLSCSTPPCDVKWKYNSASTGGYSRGQASSNDPALTLTPNDFYFETHMRTIVRSYEPFGIAGKSLTEPLVLDSSAGFQPVRSPWIGGMAITVSGSGFQDSESLWCHVLNVVSSPVQLDADESTSLLPGSPVFQSFTALSSAELQRAQLHLRLPKGFVWCTLAVGTGLTGNTLTGVLTSKRRLVSANTTIDELVEFSFATPPALTAGSVYYMSLSVETAGMVWRHQSSDVLSGGTAFDSVGNAMASTDRTFEVWMSTGDVFNAPAHYISDSMASCAVPANPQSVDKRNAMIKVSNVNSVASASDGYVPFTYHVCAGSVQPSTTLEHQVTSGSWEALETGWAQEFVSSSTADVVKIDFNFDVTSKSAVKLQIMTTAPTTATPTIIMTSEHSLSLGQGYQSLYLTTQPNLEAGQQYWLVMTKLGGSVMVETGSGYSDGISYQQTVASGAWSAQPAKDLSFKIGQCPGCSTMDPAIPSTGYSVTVGAYVSSTILGDESTEQDRLQAAQSFKAEATELINTVSLDLEVTETGTFGESDLCLWITTGAPRGATGFQDVTNGYKCKAVATGTNGYVDFVFDRGVFVEKDTTYYLTLKHGQWFEATSRWAEDSNSEPVAKQMAGMRIGGPTVPAKWRGSDLNPYWPGSSGLTGEAHVKSEGDNTLWVVQPNHDLRFKLNRCQSGLPIVLNMTIDGVAMPTGPWLGSERYGVSARSSPRGGALLTLEGFNFFPGNTLTCMFHNADGSQGMISQATVVTGDFKTATCRTPENFDPYADQDCSGISSCLGVYVTVSNDAVNYGLISGPSRASLGASTPKILISDLYVSGISGGNDVLGDGTRWRPFATIQRAINYAADVDRITLMGSTQTGEGSNGLRHLGKDIHLQALPGQLTTINCTYADGGAILQSEQEQQLWASISPNAFPEGKGTISTDSSVLFADCTGQTTIVTTGPKLA